MGFWKYILSKVAGKVPSANAMDMETLAWNIRDGKLYGVKVDGNGVKTVVFIGGAGNTVNGVTDVFVEDNAQFPIETLKITKANQTSDITVLMKPTGIVAGGIVTWLIGLEFIVGAVAFYIAKVFYTLSSSNVVLDAADPSLPRIDLICVDATPQIIVLKGVPAENPQRPTPNTSQLELTEILIPAGATTPGGGTIIADLVYDENVEWVVTSSGVVVNADFTGITPVHGTKCIDVGTIGNGDTITFTRSAPIEIAQFDKYSKNLKLKAALTKQYTMTVQLLLGGTAVSKEVLIAINNATTDWQNMALLLSNIPSSSATIDGIRLKWLKSGSAVEYQGFYLDFIKLEAGITPPATSEGWNLDAETPSGVVRTLIKSGDNVYFVGKNGLIINRYSHFTKGNIIEFELPESAVVSAYVYIAYASAVDGTGFTLINDPALDYMAVLTTDTEILEPVVGNFTGLWYKRNGTDGDDGIGLPAGGTTGQVPKKQSNANYDIVWADDETGGGGSTNLTAIPSTDKTASGITTDMVANENQAFGDLVRINATGKAQLAKADVIANATGLAMCIDNAVAANATGKYLLLGFVRNDAWNWTVGEWIYLSLTGTTGNTLTQINPNDDPAVVEDNVIQILGVANSADSFYFNPQLVQVEWKPATT